MANPSAGHDDHEFTQDDSGVIEIFVASKQAPRRTATTAFPSMADRKASAPAKTQVRAGHTLDYVPAASLVTRLGARIVDGLLTSMLTGALLFVLVGLVWSSMPDDILRDRNTATVLWLLTSGCVLAVNAVYEVGMTAAHGATVGKMLFGLRVLKTRGCQPASTSAAAIRFTILYVLGAIPYAGPVILLVLGVFLLLSPTGQGWHDKAAETVVAKAR